jgi:hypothetical protein
VPYRLKRGLGRTPAEDTVCKAAIFGGIFSPTCWTMLTPSYVGVPPAPTGDVLTVPPASGEEAQATVDALLNQQAVNQQAINAGQVSSSWVDTVLGNTSAAATSAVSSFPWILGLAGFAVFALVAIGGGSPRRYGR